MVSRFGAAKLEMEDNWGCPVLSCEFCEVLQMQKVPRMQSKQLERGIRTRVLPAALVLWFFLIVNPLSTWAHRIRGQNLAPECLGLDYKPGWVVAVLSVFVLACRPSSVLQLRIPETPVHPGKIFNKRRKLVWLRCLKSA